MLSLRNLFSHFFLIVKKKTIDVTDCLNNEDHVIVAAPNSATKNLLFDNSDDGLPISWYFARSPSLKLLPNDVKIIIADLLYKNKSCLAAIIKEIFTSEAEQSFSRRIDKSKYNSDTAINFCTSNLRSLTDLPPFVLPDTIRDSQNMDCAVMPMRMKPGTIFSAGTSMK
jgi:hypothetical protein